MAKGMKGVAAGVSVAFRGFRLGFSHPEIRRLYRQFMVVLFLVALALMGLLTGSLWYVTGIADDASAWMVAGLWILRIAGQLIILMAAPLLALMLVNALFPFLGERAFLGALRVLDPARAERLEASEGLSFAAGFASSSRRLLHFFVLTVLAFGSTLIPLVGAVIGPLIQLWATSRALTWELLDPYFDLQGLGYAEQRRYLRRNRRAVFGYGLPLSFVLSLPFVGPLCFGLAQASVALLIVEILEPEGCAGAVAVGGGPGLEI